MATRPLFSTDEFRQPGCHLEYDPKNLTKPLRESIAYGSTLLKMNRGRFQWQRGQKFKLTLDVIIKPEN